MMAERWSAFQAYAARALGKPAFEAEERTPKLRVAGSLREALSSVERLHECITAADYPAADLTTHEQNEWLEQWIASGDPQLRAALEAFGRADIGALERFATFAAAADAASTAGTIPSSPNAVSRSDRC